MGAPKGHKRFGGRKKGVPNKVTADVKAALSAAFAGMGGVKAFTAWGRENPTEFYKLWAKLLPVELKNPDGEAFRVEGVTEVVVRTREEAATLLARESP